MQNRPRALICWISPDRFDQSPRGGASVTPTLKTDAQIPVCAGARPVNFDRLAAMRFALTVTVQAVQAKGDVVMQHVRNLLSLRGALQCQCKALQRIFESLLVRGYLTESEITMSGLLCVLPRLNESFQQIGSGIDIINPTVKTNYEQHPAKIIIAIGTVLQSF
jgi:hypothetical protein